MNPLSYTDRVLWRSPDPDLHADASAASVAMVRVIVFLSCAATSWMTLQQAVFIPVGWWVPFGSLASVGASLAAALGVLPRVTMPLATVMFLVTQLVTRSLDGIMHLAPATLVLAALILTLGPSADALVLWPRRRPVHRDARYQATLVYILAAICVAYSFVAAHRVVTGGVTLFGDGNALHGLLQRGASANDPTQEPGMRLIRTPWSGTTAQVVVSVITLLELLAPLCLRSRRFRIVFVPVMLAVHLVLYLPMHLDVWPLVALLVVFVDAPRWSPRRVAVDAEGHPQPLTVYFDGVCGLCNRFVDFLLQRDETRAFRFAPLQGRTAAGIAGLPRDVDSVVVCDSQRVLVHSDAALAAISRLGGLWSFASVGGLVPRPLRDAVYRTVARHRYRWFGKHETCRIPTADEAAWFLP